MDKKDEELLAFRRTHPLFLPQKAILIIFLILLTLFFLNLLLDYLLNRSVNSPQKPLNRANPKSIQPILSPIVFYPTEVKTTLPQ